MVDTILLETLARGVAMGGFAVTGLALILDRRTTPARWVGGLFFACAIAHVLEGFGPAGALATSPIVCALAVATTGLFWALAYALFADEQRFSPHRLWPTAVMVGLWFLAKSMPPPTCKPFWLVFHLASAGLMLHALLVIWRGWRGDLVDQRRRIRGPVMLAAAGYILLISLGHIAWTSVPPTTPDSNLSQALALAVLALSASAALLRAEPMLMAPPVTDPVAAASPVPVADLTPADRLVLARLATAMDEDEVWRGEDLSISALAALVGAPEHRLRRLINGVLGHRNFADYVNGRRIEAGKAALAAPDLALKSISAIAYDLGFASLGPFNRAFRAATGVTPTEWRTSNTPAPSRLRLVETADRAPKADKSA